MIIMRLIDADALLKQLDAVLQDLEETVQPSTAQNYDDVGRIFDRLIRSAPTARSTLNDKEMASDVIVSVRQSISQQAALMQLAEEAAELAQAACKYARIKDGTNPTPVTEEKAWLAMLEEFDDVINAAKVVGLKDSRIRQFDKMIRWRERIQERSTKA